MYNAHFELELECNGVDMPTYDTHHLLPRTIEPATAAPGKAKLGRTKLKVRRFSVVWMGVVNLLGVVVSNNLPPEVGGKSVYSP